MRGRRTGLLLAVVAAVGLLSTAPAAATTQAPDHSALPEKVRAQIAEIPVESLRNSISESLAARVDAESLQEVEIDYAPYTPVDTSGADTAAVLSYPSGCGQASVVFLNGNQIWNQVFTSCDGKSWSDLDYHLRLVRINPYNPYDTKIVRDSYPDMPAGSSTSYDQTFTCRNTSKTNWDGYAKGTMVLNGTTYSATSGDIEYNVYCGW